MKGFKKLMYVLMVGIVMMSSLVGCGKKKITSINIKQGTFEYVYLQNSDVSYDDLVVIVNYNDGTKKEISYGDEDLTVTDFTTTSVGDKTITFTYKGITLTVTVKVSNNQDEVYEISGYELPASLLAYLNNRKTQTNKENEFVVHYEEGVYEDITYYVGDDNPFVFFPNITVLDENDNLVTINSYRSVSNVYMKASVDTEYSLLEGTNLTNMVAVDENKSSYDFTEEAIGNYFRIEVSPYYLKEGQSKEDFTLSWEFQVVDGYNVTDVKELGLMSNFYDEEKGRPGYLQWPQFLQDNNIETVTSLNGMIIHNNLNVTEKDIPSDFFETVNGTLYLKDCVDIYAHQVDPDGEFVMYGNYFSIDASKMPLINVATAGEGLSHSSLFKLKINGTSKNPAKKETTKTTVRDLTIIGNANRTNSEEGFGGLIMVKTRGHTVTFENCIIRTFYINLMGDDLISLDNSLGRGTALRGVTNLNNSKSYDAYQNLIYVYGGTTININNSELKRAGGPAMILQHIESSINPLNFEPVVNVDDKSVIEAWVKGSDAWFAKMGLTQTFTEIATLSTLISGTATFFSSSASFVKIVDGNHLINIVSITMASGTTIPCSGVDGSVSIAGKDIINMYPEQNQMVETILSVAPNTVVFQSSEGGVAYMDTGTSMSTSLGGTNTDPNNKIFLGDYLGLYTEGIGIVLEYLH